MDAIETIDALLGVGQARLAEARMQEQEANEQAVLAAVRRQADVIEMVRGRLPEPLRDFLEPGSVTQNLDMQGWHTEKVVVQVPGLAPMRVAVFETDEVMASRVKGVLPFKATFELPIVDGFDGRPTFQFVRGGPHYRDLPVALALARETQEEFEERERNWKERMERAQAEEQQAEPVYVPENSQLTPDEQLICDLRQIVREIVREERD